MYNRGKHQIYSAKDVDREIQYCNMAKADRKHMSKPLKIAKNILDKENIINYPEIIKYFIQMSIDLKEILEYSIQYLLDPQIDNFLSLITSRIRQKSNKTEKNVFFCALLFHFPTGFIQSVESFCKENSISDINKNYIVDNLKKIQKDAKKPQSTMTPNINCDIGEETEKKELIELDTCFDFLNDENNDLQMFNDDALLPFNGDDDYFNSHYYYQHS